VLQERMRRRTARAQRIVLDASLELRGSVGAPPGAAGAARKRRSG
jgi:hypothetical protein